MTGLRRHRGWSVCVSSVLAACFVSAVGCGKVGPPLPPEPRGPLVPEPPAVRQLGDRLRVALRLPGVRGPKPNQELVRVEVLRVEYPAGSPVQNDPDAFSRRGVVAGERYGDPFEPGAELQLIDEQGLGAAGSTLRYAVRVYDRRGRPSPLVTSNDLTLVDPLPRPGELSGEATADGVRLHWGRSGPDRRYNVYRSKPGAPVPEAPLNTTPLSSAEYLDAQATVGETYIYEVRTSFGEARPYRESEPGRPLRILVQDQFPPAAPNGLVAVQEGQAIRLFWNPNDERDLAGYRLYRRSTTADWVQIGAELIEEPLYLDADVEPGDHWEYRVVALDRAVPPNKSAPSEVSAVDVAEDPGTGDGL